MLRAFLLAIALVATAQQPSPAPQLQFPATDIHLVEIRDGLESLAAAKPRPIAVEKGYENQPFFTPDGRAILFTANRDGKQTDIYEHALGGTTRHLIATPEGEYSPTVTPDGGISVIRVEADGTQRLWRFERDGSKPRVLLPDVKPVGYHAWIDERRLALFVLGKPATLQFAAIGRAQADVVASDIGRSLHRIPNGRGISFVQRAPDGTYVVKRIDPDSREITMLTEAVAGSTDRDTAWMPDGTLLMSAGTRIYAWRPGASGWRAVYDVQRYGLSSVSRMAVAPDGRALAFVVAE